VKKRQGFVSNSSSSSFLISFGDAGFPKTFEEFSKQMNPDEDICKEHVTRIWQDLQDTTPASEAEIRNELEELAFVLNWRELLDPDVAVRDVIDNNIVKTYDIVCQKIDLNNDVYILEYDDKQDPMLESGEPMVHLNHWIVSKH